MLILLLIVAADGVFIVENPHSTLLNAQRRFLQLVQMLRARGISMLAEFAHILSYLGKEVTILETVVFLGMFLHDIPYNFKTMDCRMI